MIIVCILTNRIFTKSIASEKFRPLPLHRHQLLVVFDDDDDFGARKVNPMVLKVSNPVSPIEDRAGKRLIILSTLFSAGQ
jgi:hypothetical protein